MSKTKIIRDIENLVHKGLQKNPLPVQKGKQIRIGTALVKPLANQKYAVIDTKTGSQITSTYFKSSALGIARQWAKGVNVVQTVLSLDDELSKYDLDMQFYMHTLKSSSDLAKREVARCRYDVASSRVKRLKSDLERYVYR